MAQLKDIWIEHDLSAVDDNQPKAIRIDWDNDRHQRIEITGSEPKDIIIAMDFAVRLLRSEFREDKI